MERVLGCGLGCCQKTWQEADEDDLYLEWKTYFERIGGRWGRRTPGTPGWRFLVLLSLDGCLEAKGHGEGFCT